MQVNREYVTPTKLKLTAVASQAELDIAKQHTLRKLSQNVKVPGFRAGKAPQQLIEKQIDPAQFQTEFLEHAINDLYVAAAQQLKLRPVSQPQISITKFVPFTTLEFSAEVETVGEIKLADYTKIKLAKKQVTVTAADVDRVLTDLQTRGAAKSEVTRAAKADDEVIIDFAGVDAKTKGPISGADGKDYPLLLGSNSFIPGFEDNVVGLKPGEQKDFTLTFPKDYNVTALQNRQVTFSVTAKNVQELKPPKLDDAFAATVGPFKTLAELKADIKKQLEAEQANQAQRAFENELLEKIASKSTVAIPESLIEEEIDRLEDEEKRNIAYRGQTWQEHLDEEGITAEQHRDKQRPAAELRVKVGLVLTEIADKEQIDITPEELEIRLQLLKGQYQDAAMQAELDKPENRRDIASRMVSEKTIAKLTAYAS